MLKSRKFTVARNHAITRLPNRSVSQASVAGLMPKMFEKMQHMYPKAFVPWWSSGGLPLYKIGSFLQKVVPPFLDTTTNLGNPISIDLINN